MLNCVVSLHAWNYVRQETGNKNTLQMTHCPRTHRFRRLVRLVMLCKRLCKQSLQNLSRVWDEYDSVMLGLGLHDAKISWRGLAFRSEDFRARKQHCLKIGARHLLEREPSSRSEDDVNRLLVAMRKITAFARYPKEIQQQMCQVGVFECYEPRRVIVCTADRPQSMYFILSGAVLVTSNENVKGVSGTMTTFTKGMSFGESALISNTRNRATFCSKTEVELFSIAGSDFRKISIAGEQEMLDNDKQRQFIRNVALLRHWPIERLKDDSQTCAVQNFDRNKVVVRDSNNSDMIYIVLKGSLSVIKKLKRVEPTISRKRQTVSFRELALGYISRKKKTKHVDTWPGSVWSNYDTSVHRVDGIKCSRDRLSATNRQETYKSVHELEARLQQTLPGYHNQADRCGCLDYNQIISNYNSRLLNKDQDGGCRDGCDPDNCSTRDHIPRTHVDCQYGPASHGFEKNVSINAKVLRQVQPCSLPNIAQTNYVIRNGQGICGSSLPALNKDISRKKDENELKHESFCSNGRMESNKCVKTRNLSKSLKGVYLTPRVVQAEKSAIDTFSPDLEPDSTNEANAAIRFQTNNAKNDSINLNKAKRQQNHSRRVLDRQWRQEITHDLEQKAGRNLPTTESDRDPMIVELQVLERGQYFGVADFLFPDQPSLSVVSNGAECLVLPRKLFLKCASEECLQHLQETECPYPSDLELHQKLQEVVNWKSIRTVIYNHVAEQARRKKDNRKQFVLAYQGQYCFRTGPA